MNGRMGHEGTSVEVLDGSGSVLPPDRDDAAAVGLEHGVARCEAFGQEARHDGIGHAQDGAVGDRAGDLVGDRAVEEGHDQPDARLEMFGQQGIAQGDDVVTGDDGDGVDGLLEVLAQRVVVGARQAVDRAVPAADVGGGGAPERLVVLDDHNALTRRGYVGRCLVLKCLRVQTVGLSARVGAAVSRLLISAPGMPGRGSVRGFGAGRSGRHICLVSRVR